MAIEFISYTPTPSQKYMGVATVKIDGKYIFRYKINSNKDGNGFFPSEASYKISETGNAREDYVEAFLLDSNFDIQEIRKLIQNHVRSILAKPVKTQLHGSLAHNDDWAVSTHQSGQKNEPEENLPF